MLDERIEAIRKKYDLRKEDFWELPQRKGTYCVKHAALEVIAVKAGIVFEMPTVLEADSANGLAAMCVRGTMGDRTEWSIGEASPKNSKNGYPWAISEKRAKDRVILKLVGIHGLVYSEEEAAEFKAPGDLVQPMSKADARDLFTTVMEAVREAGNKGKAALRQYWTSEEFQEAFESFPADWRKQLVDEKEGWLASYKPVTGRVDPNESLDRQYRETLVGEAG